MTMYLGDYNEDDTVYFIWSTNDSNGASITRAVDGTVSVYKDNGTSQSTAGVTDTEDFDSLTGIHACTIDLSADAFYATGADYAVVLSGATIDGQTVNAVLAHFSIENRYPVGQLATKADLRPEMHTTTIATLASQISMTLTDGSSDDDAYYKWMAVVTDSATSSQKCIALVSAYTGSTKTITFAADPGVFTMAVGDTIDLIGFPVSLPAALPGASGGLPTVDANNRIAGIQGTKNDFDDLNDISLTDQDVVDQLMAEVLEAGKTFEAAILDIWAIIAGNSAANDTDDPTYITYDSPDDSVQRAHSISGANRTVT